MLPMLISTDTRMPSTRFMVARSSVTARFSEAWVERMTLKLSVERP
jgi:hypothetical protein